MKTTDETRVSGSGEAGGGDRSGDVRGDGKAMERFIAWRWLVVLVVVAGVVVVVGRTGGGRRAALAVIEAVEWWPSCGSDIRAPQTSGIEGTHCIAAA
jgi:hypothetical protein